MRTPQAAPPSTGKRRHRPRRARPATLTATLTTATAVIAALAGCSSQPPATTATSASARPATVVTIPTAPTAAAATPSTSGSTAGYDVLANMPPAAKQHTNAGAQAFARYYITAFSSLLMRPSPGQLSKLFSDECLECRQSEAIIADNLEHGRRYSTEFYSTKTVGEPEINGEPGDASTAQEIRLISLVSSTETTVAASGTSTTKASGRDILVQWRLKWVDGQWLVTYFRGTTYTPPKR